MEYIRMRISHTPPEDKGSELFMYQQNAFVPADQKRQNPIKEHAAPDNRPDLKDLFYPHIFHTDQHHYASQHSLFCRAAPAQNAKHTEHRCDQKLPRRIFCQDQFQPKAAHSDQQTELIRTHPIVPAHSL